MKIQSALRVLVSAAVLSGSAVSSAMAATDTLVVYFSRAGNQYNGDIQEGNTAIVAKMIAESLRADILEVKPAHDSYNLPYRELTVLAKKELEQQARPEFTGTISNPDQYRTVYIGAPVWWGDYPMVMYSFFEHYDLNGKTLLPFVTHEGSGLSGFDAKLKKIYPHSEVRGGLAIRGKTAQDNRAETAELVKNWLNNNK